MKSISRLLILFFILLVLGILYRRYEDKRERQESSDIYENIQQYLLDDDTLGKSKKPILWIHVPYEYNSRQWLSFGSRSSFNLNQPYLYLTVRSIIKKCEQSFTICIIDDNSFEKLLPGWNVDMSKISTLPVKSPTSLTPSANLPGNLGASSYVVRPLVAGMRGKVCSTPSMMSTGVKS